MLKSLERFQELSDRRGLRFCVCRDTLFRVYGRVARAVGPIVQDHDISEEDAARVTRTLGAYVTWWTTGVADAQSSEWYAVTCDRFQPLEEVPSKHRSEIRRGLKNCEVRRVDAEFVSQQGYEVYARAFERYRGSQQPIWDKAAFQKYFGAATGFEDITHFWGAFHSGHLIALAANNIYDRIEANYWMIKLDPAYLKLYPTYALIHTMNEYYLRQEGFQYVNDGWRALLHETEVQGFLIHKFGFSRHFRRLGAFYRLPLRLLIRGTFALRRRLGKLDTRLAALYTLERIRRGIPGNAEQCLHAEK